MLTPIAEGRESMLYTAPTLPANPPAHFRRPEERGKRVQASGRLH